jgi:hypothetical protein
VTLDGYTRVELLERLAHWNARLDRLHGDILVTIDEAPELDTERLRRVVDATVDKVVDIIAAGSSGRRLRLRARP